MKSLPLKMKQIFFILMSLISASYMRDLGKVINNLSKNNDTDLTANPALGKKEYIIKYNPNEKDEDNAIEITERKSTKA